HYTALFDEGRRDDRTTRDRRTVGVRLSGGDYFGPAKRRRERLVQVWCEKRQRLKRVFEKNGNIVFCPGQPTNPARSPKPAFQQLVFTFPEFSVPFIPFGAEQQGLGYKDTPLIPGTEWHVHDGDRPQPRIVTPGASFSHLAPAPSDAIVLFDGKDLSKWEI